jgi:hypothetical protein
MVLLTYFTEQNQIKWTSLVEMIRNQIHHVLTEKRYLFRGNDSVLTTVMKKCSAINSRSKVLVQEDLISKS